MSRPPLLLFHLDRYLEEVVVLLFSVGERRPVLVLQAHLAELAVDALRRLRRVAGCRSFHLQFTV